VGDRSLSAWLAGRSAGVVLVLAAFGVLVAYPLARLVGTLVDLGPGAFARAFDGPGGEALVTSLWLGVVVAAIAVSLGTAAALAAERGAGSVRRWVRIAIIGQLLVPPFVSALGWAAAYGPRGLTDRLVGISLPGMYGPVGVVAVLATEAIPLAYLVVAGAMAVRGEADLERAARASGATQRDAFRTITLPLLRPAIAAAAVLAFVLTLNAFGVPAVLGLPGGMSTMTTRIYQDLAFSADPASFDRAVVLALTLVGIGLVAILLADLLLTGRTVRRIGTTSAPAARVRAGRGGRVALVIVAVAVVATAVVPFVALVLVALTRAVGLAPIPENWTLDNFATVLDGTAIEALRNSLVLGVVAATVATALGGLVVAIGRRRGRVLGSLSAIGFAIPGSTLALAALIAYGGALRDTLALILVAYLAKFWALGHRPLAGAADRLPADLIRASRASGATAMEAVRTVAVPLLRVAIVSAWLLVFLYAIHEVTMSSLLYGPGTATLAVVVLKIQQLGDPTVTAALAVLLTGLVAVAAIPILIGRRIVDRPAIRE
jgi:iron(III) transport system permease protein